MDDKELVRIIKENWGDNLIDMNGFSKVDSFIYVQNSTTPIALWVERKTRNVPFDAYPDVVVDYAKWEALIKLREITDVPAILAYGWSCGTAGFIEPSMDKKITVKVLTPSMDSVSLNKGVERKVVHIDKSEFKFMDTK